MSDYTAVDKMCANYEALIADFVNMQVSARDFKSAFFRTFQNDKDQVVGPAFDVLDGLFFYVDEFVADPGLRKRAGGLDDEELRDRAREAYQRLQSAPGRTTRPNTFIDVQGFVIERAPRADHVGESEPTD